MQTGKHSTGFFIYMYLGIQFSLSDHQINNSIFHQNEFWKDIKGHEGLYQISTLGRIQALEKSYTQMNRWGTEHIVNLPKKVLMLGMGTTGYLALGLFKNKIRINAVAHRMVAMHFIPNPQNKPQVNHKNGIKTDNRAINLEWCTRSENMKHSYAVLKQKKTYPMLGRKGGLCPNSKPVLKICPITNNILKEYNSGMEAAFDMGVVKSSIYNCISGTNATCRGFKWAFKKDYFE